jgi:transcription elongation factor SPT6
MLTKESPDTFNVGRIVLVRVMFVQRERPPRLNGDDSSVVPAEAALQPAFQEIDNVKWYSCPRCHKGGYDDLARMWDHMDTWTKGTGGNDQCPGKARGVMCRLENGLVGIIKLDNLSDESENIQDPSQKVSVCCHFKSVHICAPFYRRISRSIAGCKRLMWSVFRAI